MATFVNNLRLKEITPGDEDGTWGGSTNINLELIADAFGTGTVQLAGDANETFTMDDGAADAVRALVIDVTSAVSLTATRTVTLAPNTVNKVWVIKNSTTGGQAIEVSQGSGANVTIANGETKAVYGDGAGSGAAVADFLAGLVIGGAFGVEGAVTFESSLGVAGTATLAEVDIGGGAIDGTVIGGSSPAAGTFTTLAGTDFLPDSVSISSGGTAAVSLPTNPWGGLVVIHYSNNANANANRSELYLINSREAAFGGGNDVNQLNVAQGTTGAASEIASTSVTLDQANGELDVSASTVGGSGTINILVRFLR